MTLMQKALIVLACALLPRRQRLRYRAEFVTELLSLPRGSRTAYAVATLRMAPRLGSELRRVAPAPLLCRLGLHHDRRTHHPDDMTIKSRTCRRCGRIKDISRYLTRGDAEGVAYGNIYLSSGH